MKKKPEISAQKTDPNLAGTNTASSWVQGRNCVYHDRTEAQYRVSIRTPGGWKSYGHFEDLETATYVANVAILAEQCEEKYQLNQVGEKNRDELARWRRLSNHANLEKVASDRFKQVREKEKLEALREKERLEEERAASTIEYKGATYMRYRGMWISTRTGERKTSLESKLDRIWRGKK